MTDIIRSNEEIEQMIDAIQSAHDGLPELNAFGDSNAQEKWYMEIDIQDLKLARRGLLPADNDEVRNWLTGNGSSTLGDYLN